MTAWRFKGDQVRIEANATRAKGIDLPGLLAAHVAAADVVRADMAADRVGHDAGDTTASAAEQD